MAVNESDIAFINHNLRNNIGVAISYLQLMTIDSPDLDNNDLFKFALENLNHSIELTETISVKCKANKADLTKHNPELTIVPLKEYLENQAKPWFDKMRKMYDIEIIDTYKMLDEEKYIIVDANANHLARENIINNAVKAGATLLTVSYVMKEAYGEVNFKDNGRGMTQEDIDKILLSIHGDGVVHGLGTKAILNIAKSQGFYITYNSTLGEGTNVRVITPYINV